MRSFATWSTFGLLASETPKVSFIEADFFSDGMIAQIP